MLNAKSLFIEVSSLTPAQLTTMLDELRLNHRAPGDAKIWNLVLTSICDLNGNLYTEQLDAIRPYLPGGDKVACDNVYVGSNWAAWDPAAYGVDKSQWYNHYAVWGGMLNERYRWAQINLSVKAWKAFKARYNLPWMHFYISNEGDLQTWSHPTLGSQLVGAYEALLLELCRQAKAIEPNRSVLWSPFCWTPYSQVPADEKTRMATAITRVFSNVQRLSGMGINVLAIQDGVGARPGIVTQSDAAGLYSLLNKNYGFGGLRINVEQFKPTAAGFDADPSALTREKWYIANNYPIGASWELRYAYKLWQMAPPPVIVPTPDYPKIEFLTREQWGADTRLPRLGYFVPAARRTELHVHHTAVVDGNDSTPNRWRRDEALGYMQRLQRARPDLGLDIPYTYVFFVLEDLSVIICEGRGLLRTGAHTAGHNTAGFGWSVGGNFDKRDDEAADALLKVVKNEARYLRANGFPNLCSTKNPRGWDLWGHRDSSPKSCPGNTLYPKLANVNIV